MKEKTTEVFLSNHHIYAAVEGYMKSLSMIADNAEIKKVVKATSQGITFEVTDED